MRNEEKYKKLFSKASSLTTGLIRLDKIKSKKIGLFDKLKLMRSKSLYYRSTKYDPDNAAPYLMMAKIDERLSDYHSAIRCLEQAWSLQKGHLIIAIELSGSYGMLNRHSDAIAILNEALSANGNEPRLLCNLALSYLLAGEIDKSLDIFNKLVQVEPNYEMNHKLLAYAIDVKNGIKETPSNQADIAKNI